MKNKNYHDYDTLKLFAKKEKVEEIISRYQLLKWEIVGQQQNKSYEDIVDLEFIRPHKIKNKDELQLLQVYMEEELNNFAKKESKKHSKSTIAGLSVGLFGISLMSLGIWINFAYSTIASLIFSLIFFMIGTAFLATEMFFLPKMIKQEKQIFLKDKKEHKNKMEILCDAIHNLEEDK